MYFCRWENWRWNYFFLQWIPSLPDGLHQPGSSKLVPGAAPDSHWPQVQWVDVRLWRVHAPRFSGLWWNHRFVCMYTLCCYISTLSVFLSVCLSVCLSDWLIALVSAHLSVCLSVSLSVSLSTRLFVCLSDWLTVLVSAHLSVCLSDCLCLFACLSVWLSSFVCWSTHISFYLVHLSFSLPSSVVHHVSL